MVNLTLDTIWFLLSGLLLRQTKYSNGVLGELANIELRTIFSIKNGVWEKIDIYYQ